MDEATSSIDTRTELIWARESAGYDTSGAASRLGVSDEKLESIESGEAQITYVQLRKAAEVATNARWLRSSWLPRRQERTAARFSDATRFRKPAVVACAQL